jgi:hypothetical protein
MPNKNTFSIQPIKDLIEIYHQGNSIDPFANTSKIANKTNDLNPEFDTDFNMDALDFLKMFKSNSVEFVFYDPPYSLRQVSECYKNVGINVTQETTRADWNTRHKEEIKRILKPSGIVMSFGWNSNGIGGSDLKLIELLVVAHGGQHHDTLVTVERKIQNTFGF